MGGLVGGWPGTRGTNFHEDCTTTERLCWYYDEGRNECDVRGYVGEDDDIN